jgi:uncharacterized protein (TIGR02246 family)
MSVDFELKRRMKMNTPINWLLFCAGVALFALVHPAFAQNDHAADEAVIRENVKQMVAGWNTKSGALFATPFAEDADYVVINGNHIKGRVEIEQGHQRIFDTVYKDTTLTLEVRQIRFLRPDVAVVHVNGHRDGPAKDQTQGAIMTMVMTKEKQGWKIAAFQNTAIVSQ